MITKSLAHKFMRLRSFVVSHAFVHALVRAFVRCVVVRGVHEHATLLLYGRCGARQAVRRRRIHNDLPERHDVVDRGLRPRAQPMVAYRECEPGARWDLWSLMVGLGSGAVGKATCSTTSKLGAQRPFNRHHSAVYGRPAVHSQRYFV